MKKHGQPRVHVPIRDGTTTPPSATDPDSASRDAREAMGPAETPAGSDAANSRGGWDAETAPDSDPETRCAEYLDQLQRLKAEFDNYRRRTAKEREDWFVLAQAEIAEALLPVLDDVRRAREHESSGEAAEPDGWRLILKRFEDVMTKLGLEAQEAEPGREFDPEHHDAVMAEASAEIPEGRILRVLEPGYLFRGRLLRRSRVSYSTGPPGE